MGLRLQWVYRSHVGLSLTLTEQSAFTGICFMEAAYKVL